MDEEWRASFTQDASLFPHLLDVVSDRVMLSRLSERDYQNASFLDQRIVTDTASGQWVPWHELGFFDSSALPPAQYIFHIGHVGSTLISRLLGEIPTVFALREPQILRNLAEFGEANHRIDCLWSPEQYASRLPQALGWLSRRFHDNQTALIKASSFVSAIAGDIIGPDGKAVFLFAAPERYLETILAGPASLREMHVLSTVRIKRLEAQLQEAPAALWQMSETQKIAMSWLSEMTALFQASAGTGASPLWLNFDDFLLAPAEKLQEITKYFGHDLSDNAATALVSSPIMSTYSKAPEHKYSPDLRRQLLQQAGNRYRKEIQCALSWMDEVAKKSPLVARILDLVDEVS